MDTCIQAFLEEDDSINIDVVLSWYDDVDVNKEKLRRIVDERIEMKLAAKKDCEKMGNAVYIKQVSETFPGIIITHFCKNENYIFSYNFVFPIGFYVFWEIVVKQVLHISSFLGCQYLYLFAADNTEQVYKQTSIPYLGEWEDEEGNTDSVPVYKLVEYYKNELKFEEVQDVGILKPYYDFECFGLIQEINALQKHREEAWIQHSDVIA